MERPKIIWTPNLTQLLVETEKMLDYLESDYISDDVVGDYESAILEKIMVAIYGKDFWGWFSEKVV